MAAQAPLPADLASAPSTTLQEKPGWLQSRHTQNQIKVWALRIVIWLVLIIVLFPVVYVVMTSFKADGRGLSTTSLFPREYTLDLYKRLLNTETSNFLN